MRVLQPLARRGVALLSHTAVEPWQVVVAHTLVGLLAAVLVSGSSPVGWLVAAVLLQLKSLLDNIDGGLARATNRVTELGRYLDTGLDLLVNVALFAALSRHGPPALAVVGLVVLTVVLSCDFVTERLYRSARAETRTAMPAAATGEGPAPRPAAVARPPAATPPPPAAAAAPQPGGDDSGLALRLFRGLYRAVLAPQDAALTRLDQRLFERASGRPAATATPADRRRWNDLFSTAALVNLGLSTQYVALGVCLVAGAPFAYVYLVLLQAVYVVVVQAIRVSRYAREAAGEQ